MLLLYQIQFHLLSLFCLLLVLSLIFLAAIHTAIQWFNATILNLFLMLHDFICIIGLTFVFMVSWHACSHFINLNEVTKKTIFCWNFTLKYIKPRRVFFSNKIYNSTSILFMPCLQIDEGKNDVLRDEGRVYKTMTTLILSFKIYQVATFFVSNFHYVEKILCTVILSNTYFFTTVHVRRYWMLKVIMNLRILISKQMCLVYYDIKMW